MLIRTTLDLSKPMTLTEDELKELEEINNYPITFDEDCPPLDIEKAKRYLKEQREQKLKVAV